MELDRKQINCLITGTVLSAELPAVNEGNRRFVTLFPYVINERGTADKPDKMLDESKQEEVLFSLRDCEYPSKYIENDWDVYDGDVIYHRNIKDLKGISALQEMLAEIMSDFTHLVPLWETDDIL
ncbi:MAG: hypothetical protein IIZ09_11905 [Ruminococcus sp.]|nr:hypothetical protein [Ruminococcus sp.]